MIKIIDIKDISKMDIVFIINDKETYNKIKNNKKYLFNDIDSFYDFIKKEKITDKIKIGFIGNNIEEYTSLLKFIIYYKNTKKKIEKEMLIFNKSINNDNNHIINDALNKFKYANCDGKCIRGTLIDLGYKLYNNDDYSLSLSAAYEAFETSILIHDDIIDNSDLRRGKSTIQKLYQNEFENYNIDTTPYSLALCIGDIGFFYTYNYIIDKYKNDKNLNIILTYYNNIVIDTIKGEILDVYLPYIEKNDKSHKLLEEDIMKIYELKTSIYSIVGPFILGMILSDAKEKDIKEFYDILMPIGISFQIKDDILGIFSKEKHIGKSVVSDIEEFKQTILYSYIKNHKKEYLDDLLKYYGKKTSEKDLLKVQEILINSGSLKYAEDKMNELFTLSKNKIENLNIKKEIKDILLGLIVFLRYRKK